MYHYNPIHIAGVVYETQEQHEWRIARENKQDKRDKRLSRSRVGLPLTRRDILRRAFGVCEICSFGYTDILNIHHIYPVSLGGSAHYSNLIAICPNCHALVHRFGRGKGEVTPRRLEMLAKIGYSEPKARRLLLVASKNARVIEGEGLLPWDRTPKAQECVIVDGPNVSPEELERYYKAVDRLKRRSQQYEHSVGRGAENISGVS